MYYSHEHVGDLLVSDGVGMDAGQVEPQLGTRSAVTASAWVVAAVAVTAEVFQHPDHVAARLDRDAHVLLHRPDDHVFLGGGVFP